MEENTHRKKRLTADKKAGFVMVAPIAIWLIVLLMIPVIYVLVVSFMTRGTYGNIVMKPTLQNYSMIFSGTYLKIVLNSLKIALAGTFLCILIAYPVAYYMAKHTRRAAGLILLIMLPFCTSSLVRNYSWVVLLNTSGIVNSFLMKIGLITEPIQFLYNDTMVMVGLIYAFMPFAVLPIYSSIEKIDWSLLEAAKDLGAKPRQVFWKVTLPMTSSGIFAAVIQVFIPSLGIYFISDLLGGGNSMMIGNLIRNQFLQSNNWPFGAALSIVLILITLGILFIYTKVGGDIEDLGT